MEIDRREFLQGLASVAATAGLPVVAAQAEAAPVPEEACALVRAHGVWKLERLLRVPVRFVYPANTRATENLPRRLTFDRVTNRRGAPFIRASLRPRPWQAHDRRRGTFAPYVCRGFRRVAGPGVPSAPLD
jgi:hypothetical protein